MLKAPLYLLTDAAHFDVSYTINPWMTPHDWRRNERENKRAALTASRALSQALEGAGARLIVLDGRPGLPDMVFPANAAIVLDRRALVARFRYAERRGEERHFLAAFRNLRRQGLLDEVRAFPEDCWQEGAGDCIWDASRQIFWAGFGPRSMRAAIPIIEDFFGAPVTPLELVSDRFYHLDVCFLALPCGEIVYYPPAFSKAALANIKDTAPADLLIEASTEDAERFSVNAVNIGKTVIMAAPSARLRGQLAERGYEVKSLNLKPFMMAGGGAYCMTLRLDRVSSIAESRAQHAIPAALAG